MTEITMMQRVGAAILLAEQEWNPKRARESKEVVMARAAIEAMREPTPTMVAAAEKRAKEVGAHLEMSPEGIWQEMAEAALSE